MIDFIEAKSPIYDQYYEMMVKRQSDFPYMSHVFVTNNSRFEI